MTDATMITHRVALGAFHVAFLSRVGHGENKISKADLSDSIEVDVRAIKGWADGQSVPEQKNLLKLYAFFGSAFTSEVIAPSGLGGVNPIEKVAVNAGGAVADLAAELNRLTERLRDGNFCHRDRAKTGPELIELGAKMEAQGRAMMNAE